MAEYLVKKKVVQKFSCFIEASDEETAMQLATDNDNWSEHNESDDEFEVELA